MSSLLVFNRVYSLEILSVCWYFRPSFVNYCPSNLLSDSMYITMYNIKCIHIGMCCDHEGNADEENEGYIVFK